MTGPDPQRMPRGTYPVELRCLCKRNGRYFSVKCPDRDGHGRHDEQDWYSVPPVYEEPHMTAARAYHEEYMASRRPAVAESDVEAA